MKYFGTDGIRQLFSNDLLLLTYKTGFAFAKDYDNILVAIDTRASGVDMAKAFISGAIKGGAKVSYAGILPTPALCYAVRTGFYKAGAMITASHNSEPYNGIKLFDGEGYKLHDGELCKLEKDIECFDNEIQIQNTLPPITGYAKQHYLNKLLSTNIQKNNKRLLVDCANGATIKTAFTAFKQARISVDFIGTGGIINKECGVFFTQNAINIKRQGAYDLAFLFDGDGDRLVCIDEQDQVMDGDQILYILAKHLLEQGTIKQGTPVVGTVYSSLGLELSLDKLGLPLIRTDVGDRFIAEVMRRQLLPLGGEHSGHIIYNSTTGDGLKTALILTKLSAQQPIYELKKGYISTVRKEFALNYSEQAWQKLNNAKQNVAQTSQNDIRVLIRKSGTEPLIRILVEGFDPRSVDDKAQKILSIVA